MGNAKKTAIVTGASSGIGEHMARMLAQRGYDLVIVARRLDRLEKLKAEISAAHGVSVTTLQLDLSEPGSAEKLHAQTEGAGTEIEVLINNAGFGTQGGSSTSRRSARTCRRRGTRPTPRARPTCATSAKRSPTSSAARA